MKQGFYLFLFGLCLCVYGYGDPRNADVPFISSIIEQRDGSKISLRYPALHWPATIQSATENMPLVSQSFTPTMATMETNVQLKIGLHKVDPGRFQLGITHQSPNTWYFQLTQRGRVAHRQQLHMRTSNFKKAHLLFLFEPGVTTKDFIFSFQYGNLFTSFRWTITGVPPQAREEIFRPIMNPLPQPSTAKTQPATAKVSSVTEQKSLLQVKPTPKKSRNEEKKDKAGSGAFRKLIKKEDNEDS